MAAVGDQENNPTVEAKLLDLSVPESPITVGDLTLMGNLSDTSIGLFQFLPDAPITLKPDKTYYFALGVSSGDGMYYWQIEEEIGYSEGPGTIPDQYAINQQGSGWNIYAGSPQLIAVDGKPYAVPEPAAILSASLMAIAGLVAARRFRRRS
ncbi:MAG TPA: choice-of-anchor R domain-containing protein [Candidatus Paceibacterota bacterium]|nr:choice-of-anchor R domain-containing protein [Verrucomicrobiota bacterium]HRZ46435.1 choice-of-anchor R domain-containing protein [Candidatus Paceibacterota bacterium]